MLSATSQQVVNAALTTGTVSEMTYFTYGTSKVSVRKVTERQNGTCTSEHLYLLNAESYREYGADGATPVLARKTLHVLDDRSRVAQVETTTLPQGATAGPAVPTVRYQLDNHLGSAVLELDASAALFSYEEFALDG